MSQLPRSRPQYAPLLPFVAGATLKVRRAEQHLADLNAQAAAYIATDPYRVVEDLYKRPGRYQLRIKVLQWPPPEWAPLIGDVLGNLRSALDHLIYDLTLKHSGKPLDGTAFPILSNPKAWDAADAKGNPRMSSGVYMTRGVHEMAREEIERMQPYRSGQNPLGAAFGMLNKLVNADKHRTLTLCGTAIRTAVLWSPPGIERWVTGPGPFVDGSPVASIDLVNDEKPDFQLDLTFDVAFDHWSPYPGAVVIPTLRSLADAVISALAILGRFAWA